jgi:hypothetical protein
VDNLILIGQSMNKLFAALILCVAAYALFIVSQELSVVYQSADSFFDQQGSIYPVVITIITALVPVSAALVAYLVFSNKRTYFIFLPLAHVVFLLHSYLVYGMVALVFIWWFSKYAVKFT